jgi:hypothetical protein
MQSFRYLCAFTICIGTIAAMATDAHAQAWVPDKGGLGVSLDYNFFTSSKVVTDTDLEFDDAGSTGHQITLGAEYAPIDKLGITASLPVVMLKYTGSDAFVHPGGGEYDDGDFHTTLTDLRAGARYQVLAEPLAIAPHLAFSIPVADYETVGNTVAGRHLKMAHIGASFGYIIGVATYLHFSYEFTLAEKYDRTADTEKYTQNRSDFAFTAGTKVLDYRLDLHLGANYRMGHGGVNFSEFEAGELTMDEALYHDAILDEHVMLVGGGVGYDLTNTLTATLDVRVFLAALSQNTLNASVVALGFSWTPL